ncbi:stage V sporulation protein AA [Ferviditalea candida]|uniref:Stage V sporulation protein AA n=1 Tax=Ferviditalea candida TaxID=3108399 RepID=A0ABU5ZJR9_9BACL|nr:stage V sporulation protein AA [Paenibacillaceae bacterium T2]
MQENPAPTLYLRLRKKMKTGQGQEITLGQVAQLIADPEYEQDLRAMQIYRPSARDGNLVLIDMMMIVAKVKERFPFMSIEHFGEPHVLVEIAGSRMRRPSYVLLFFTWLLLFIGSGLAIMNFHADVDMAVAHRRIYELVTGHRVKHPYLLQIPYSFGIGAGMILFFNHLFKKKINEEPSPLDVEIFTYQESVHRYVITEEYGKLNSPERDSS